MNQHSIFRVSLTFILTFVAVSSAWGQPPFLSPDSVGLASGDLIIGVNQVTGDLQEIFFKNRPINQRFEQNQTASGPFGGPATVTSVTSDGERIVVTGTSGLQEFHRTYRFLHGSNTLEVSTTLPSVSERTVLFDQMGISQSNKFVDRVPVNSPGGRDFASIIAAYLTNESWDYSIVSGTSDSMARKYGGASSIGIEAPPFDMLREVFNAPPLTDPSALIGIQRDNDGGGRSGRIGAAKIVDPSTTPQTLAVTYSFGSTPQQAFDEYKSFYNAELAPLPLESRLSTRGAELLTGDPAGGSLFIGSPSPQAIGAFLPVYVRDAFASVEWTANSFELTPADRDFTINHVEATILLPEILSRPATIEGVFYTVEYKNLIVSLVGNDLHFDTFSLLSTGVSIDPLNVVLVGGTCEVTPTFGPPYYVPSTLEPVPSYSRDFALDPLASTVFPVSLPSLLSNVSLGRADYLFPENLLMNLSLNAVFSPFDELPINLAMVTTAPIVIGVPEVATLHLFAAGTISFASLRIFIRLITKRN